MKKSERHNFIKDFPIWKACGKENNLRPCLEDVWFKNGLAYASDAVILAIVPLEVMTVGIPEEQLALLDSHAIKGKDLKMITSWPCIEIKEDPDSGAVCIVCYPSGTCEVTVQLNTDKHPDADSILAELGKLEPDPERPCRFGLHASLLQRLAASLGDDCLSLTVKRFDKGILVEPVEDQIGRIGVILPLLF